MKAYILVSRFGKKNNYIHYFNVNRSILFKLRQNEFKISNNEMDNPTNNFSSCDRANSLYINQQNNKY